MSGARPPVLRSPVSGRPLAPDTPHSLGDGAGERWPVIDAIAYLRTGRVALVADALARLDAGDRDGALALLLADQDDWWTGPPADPASVAALVRDASSLTFREAMGHLGFGRVGDYFAHRWSDPTYLGGLALLEAHWAAPDSAFELCCGAGHYLRELARRGVACTGADVVFAKLWLARHWIVGDGATLLCFDAASPWPTDARADLVFCHDAFYFLEPKPAIAARLRDRVAPGGTLALAHVHNRDCANHSSGAAASADQLARLFPAAIVYDDAELTRALVERRAPVDRPWSELAGVEAFSLMEGSRAAVRPLTGGLAMPRQGASLTRNPLYGADDRVAWPSDRYRDEYAPRATYPARTRVPSRATHDVTTHDAATDAMARSRELLDLPERW